MLKVLVVEDSEVLGELFKDFLTLTGYDVVGVAQTLDEAAGLAHLYDPDLAVVDFRLGGGEFGTKLPTLIGDRSNLGILYVSGDALSRELTRRDGEGFVQKPVGMNDLDRCLRAVRAIKMQGHCEEERRPACFHALPDPPESKLRVA
jgi:DNA-binding response OmpR family regulator